MMREASLATIDLVAKEFVALTEKYEQTHWDDPERSKIKESLDKIVGAHWQNEWFVSQVENSGSEAAARSIKVEIHIQEVHLANRQRGLER